jgi:microcystin-dependent protein
MARATAGEYRYPHSVAAVLQQLRLTLGADAMRAVGDTAALLDDRDRWVEDNLAALHAGGVAGAGGTPSGGIMDFAGPIAPEGWLLCDGAAVSREDYAALFEAIGTTWGAGDGSTTFNVPDLRGRAAIGSGDGPSTSARTVGQTGGAETHTLTTAEMPVHSHAGVQQLNWTGAESSPGGGNIIYNSVGSGTTGNAGSGGAHNNMQPFAVVTKIIKA